MSGIVVGVDDSPSSRAALRWAVAEAELRGTGLHVVSAWEIPFAKAGQDDDDDPLPAVPSLEQAALSELAAAVAEAGGDPADPATRIELVHGSPSRVLIDAAKDADLVVLGSRGRGGFSGLVLGSVGRQVIHHAACPVVVVR
ncbi:universal stress protein [Catenulispora yoronensis]|uniref:Universal stress protein n=1 Tax=Catenulispora yoronensis TaxID=450799 RepID=A0ABP5F5Y2_9ACTN